MKSKLSKLFEKYAIYFVLLFLVIFFSFTSNVFLTPTNIINVLRQVSVVGILAVGMTFVILTGGIDLSIGGVVACTGVITAQLMLNGWSPILAILVSILFAAVVGVVNAFFSHEFKLNPMIVTLATLQILKGISYILTGGIPVYGFTEKFKVIGQGYIGVIPTPVIIMTVLFIIGYFILKYTSFGQSVYGIGGNEEAVRLTGINIRKQKYKVYVLCSVLAAIAGIVLLSRVNNAQPNAGFGYEMDVITGVVLGGVSMSGGEGKITGVFAGILVMAILGNGMLMMNISEYYQWVVKGIVMLAAISYDRILKKGKKLIMAILKKGLVVSCQATKEEPMHGSDIMARMAIASEWGGAVAVRVNTFSDLVAVRAAVKLPILGLIKEEYEGYYPYITPTMKEVDKVVESGAEIVCIDATCYDRPDGNDLKTFVQLIREKYPNIEILADVSTVEEGIYADGLGVDYVATTLSGYTPDTIDKDSQVIQEFREPDFKIIEELAKVIKAPIVAEGKFWNAENAIRAFKLGAYAVTIGAGITRPQIITKRVVDEIKANVEL